MLAVNRSNSAKENRARAEVWTYVRRLGFRPVRCLAAGALTVALLTPFLCGLILFAQDDACCCKMGCCKTAKGSCCHRSRQSDHPTGAGWAKMPGCPAGC